MSSVPKFGMPHEDAITFSARPHSSDTVLATRGSVQAAPGRGLALRRPLDIKRDERHQRREPVAMIDVIALFNGTACERLRLTAVLRSCV